MKNKKWIIILFLGFILAVITGVIISHKARHTGSREEIAKDQYFCPMHPNFVSDKKGSCSICGMDLVKKESENKISQASKKIKYYRNPMNPEVTSPVPMKDSMGMDYVPVYQGPEADLEIKGVYISPEKQQLIGVTKEKVAKINLTTLISTVGRVAYDPELYVAQQEFLQALKTSESTKNSTLVSVTQQTGALLSAAKKKLFLLGMTKDQIEELAQQNKPQDNLYLPMDEEQVWVYITIYEYEIGLVKAAQEVDIDALAYPGVAFKGKVMAVTPVLNSQTRSLQVRVLVDDPDHKLKPEMFVNAKIKVDLGEKLAVAETAVLDTGIRKIVYLAKENDTLEPREVNLGQKAQGYYEVLDGLKEGDIVVTSGNFLIDSESKLKSALSGQSHQHSQ